MATICLIKMTKNRIRFPTVSAVHTANSMGFKRFFDVFFFWIRNYVIWTAFFFLSRIINFKNRRNKWLFSGINLEKKTLKIQFEMLWFQTEAFFRQSFFSSDEGHLNVEFFLDFFLVAFKDRFLKIKYRIFKSHSLDLDFCRRLGSINFLLLAKHRHSFFTSETISTQIIRSKPKFFLNLQSKTQAQYTWLKVSNRKNCKNKNRYHINQSASRFFVCI